MKRGVSDKKTFQSTWEDLGPWVEQLYEEHGVYVAFKVLLFAQRHRMKPVVAMSAWRVVQGMREVVVREETRELSLRSVNHAEYLALQMASRLLLDLENEKERAERQDSLFNP